ncbi:GDSL-like lipase/acylhydrolase family protein [Williamsia limnetica]|uniref:GDSL-like lipase/acylhydrolase family protein n=1 Tax=Williamsia limnetica TaxID=882452 RepID=A0A318RNF9_WILLI|nr:SGNH/GDSL hydrolase family protein [Williamsia limnetica]PYE20154.1 GDSL-like lipase/acylhydrolase family protein [Williamsia limnetica]
MNQYSTTPITLGLLRGAADLEYTAPGVVMHRLPAAARSQHCDPQLTMAESQPAGVRLVFRTAATLIELDVLSTKRHHVGLPPRPDDVFELFVDGQPAGRAIAPPGTTITVDMAAGTVDHRPGPVSTLEFGDLGPGVKDVEIWLPHNENMELVELRTDAPVEPATDTPRPVWVHYGSSISQGSGAHTPSTTWPAIAAAAGGVDLVNLGLAGSAMLDPFVARAIRDTPADIISLKIGINIVNADLMRLRAFTSAVHGFLDTIRDGHRLTPIVVVSPIYCPIHENTPGPGAFDPSALAEGRVEFRATGDPSEVAAGKLTLTVIRDELARIVAGRAADDQHLHYLDGRDLYGEADFAELPLPDNLHPDAATHERMGHRFAAASADLRLLPPPAPGPVRGE